jgi:hypothetical protein
VTVEEVRRHLAEKPLLEWSLRTQDPRPVPLYFDLSTFEPTATPSYPA